MRKTGLVLFGLIAVWAASSLLPGLQEDTKITDVTPWPGAQFIDLPNGRTHYIDTGPRDAPAILLFHGSGRGVADWQEGLIKELSDSHRVIAFDYYGNGFSDRGFGLTYGYNLWARQGIQLLDALGVERALFVGHSVGGVIAMIAASDYTDHAFGVVTIGTGTAMDPAQIVPFIPIFGEVAFAQQSRFSDVFSPQHEAFIDAAHRIHGTRWAFLVYIRRQYTIDGLRVITGLYKELPVRSLHVSGTEDASIPHDAARAVAAETGGDFAAIDGVGHDVHVEAPGKLAALIKDFANSED